tara:strand:+ start:3191 stop:3802 length:612 start_codon:yes stop_codon:yes gene_type:complete
MANKNFWASEAAEAKRKYRYILRVTKDSGVGPTNTGFEEWLISKVTRPSFSISETSHSYLNHTFYFPGRLTWNDVSFTVVDAINPDSTGILMGMLAASGYVLPKNVADNSAKGTISKQSSIIHFTLQSIDASGDPIDEWSLKNAWITSTSLGEFDYTGDDLMSFDVTLKYDYATYEIKKGTGGLTSKQTKQLKKLENPGNEVT